MPAPRIVIQPRPPAGRAARAAAHEALDVERDGRLRERVVARPEPGPLVGAVHRLGELVEQALQVGHGRALVDHQALDLEELGRRAWRRSPRSGSSGREQRADRRLGRLHDADLPGRRVRAQQAALDVDVERVPQVAGRVVGRDVEHLEVGEVVLDLGALVGRRTRTARRSPRSRASPRCSGGASRGGSAGRAW